MKYYWSSSTSEHGIILGQVGQIPKGNPIPLDFPMMSFFCVSFKLSKSREKIGNTTVGGSVIGVRPVFKLHQGFLILVFGEELKKFL